MDATVSDETISNSRAAYYKFILVPVKAFSSFSLLLELRFSFGFFFVSDQIENFFALGREGQFVGDVSGVLSISD